LEKLTPATPKAPKTYQTFVDRFPLLGEAWEKIREQGEDGPLDEKPRHLVKLGIAIGAGQEGFG